MHGYTDASLSANPDNRRTSDYLFKLPGTPLSLWGTTKTLTAQSPVESKLIAISFGERKLQTTSPTSGTS